MDDKRFDSLYPTDSRFEEIEKILSFIKEGKSVQMISLPGSGRSNLLGFLSYNRNIRIAHLGENEQTKFHFVFINLSEMSGRPLMDATKFIFLSLADSLSQRNIIEDYQTVDKIFKESIASNDELVIFQGLKKTIDYLALEKDLNIVFLFDKFQGYIPSITPPFFTNLRSLRDRAKYKFSVVFSLSHPLTDLIETQMMEDFYEFVEGNMVYLPIEDKPGLEFRIKYIEEKINKKIDSKTISEIIKLTGGHGKLTRISIEEVYGQNEIDNLGKYLITNNKILETLHEIWRIFTPQEREILEDIEGQTEIPNYLLEIGIIKDGEIAIPLFHDYLKIKIEEEKNKPLIFDPEKQEIRKGNSVFSNGMTSQEFKLLSFLIENKDRVVTREEVINKVWGELKSTAGVTEQALDQLIFRLRKKIEENPNSPKHIETVKGRGFKFSQ